MLAAIPAPSVPGSQTDATAERAEAAALDAEMQNGSVVERDHTATAGVAGLLKSGLAVRRRRHAARRRLIISKALTLPEGAHC